MNTRSIKLIAAPTEIQPGGYVGKAYAARGTPLTTQAEVESETSSDGFTITLRWRCAQPVIDASDNPRQFIDACALLVPEHPDAPWMTMGGTGMPVAGVLWRADRTEPYAIRAEGFGTVQRSQPPAGWKAESAYANGLWQVTFRLPSWPALAAQKQFAIAIWQGAQSERAGLKSVSPGWMPL